MNDFRDQNSTDQNADWQYSRQKRVLGPAEKMERAALFLSIASVALSFFLLYLAIPLSAIAIILALLSRDHNSRSFRCKIAVTLAVLQIIGSTAATAYYSVKILTDPVMRKQFEQLLDYYYPDLDQDLQNLYPLPDQSVPSVVPDSTTINGGTQL